MKYKTPITGETLIPVPLETLVAAANLAMDSSKFLVRGKPDPAMETAGQIFESIAAYIESPCEDLEPHQVRRWLKDTARADFSRRVELLRALKWIQRAFAARRS
jgi:hypothetical protein